MIKNQTNPILSAAREYIIFSLLFFGTLLLFPINLYADEQINTEQINTISVNGLGKISKVPDTVWITSGVTTQDPSAVNAVEANNQAMNNIIALLKKENIAEKNILTTGFNVNPLYDYSNRNSQPGKPAKLIGYRVTNSVNVKISDLQKVGKLLDLVLKAGSNQISDVRFGFDDVESLLDEARISAMENASKKATLFAEAAGMKIGKVININEAGTSGLPSINYRRQKVNVQAMDSSSVPIMGGEKEITASVTVVYELVN